MSVSVSACVDLYNASSVGRPNALSALVPCEMFSASAWKRRRVADRVRETVPGGRTYNGESPAAVCAESVPL